MNYIHSFSKHIRHDKNPVVKRRCLMFYLVCFVWLDFWEANVETFYIPGLPIQVHISQKLSQCIIVGFQGGKQRKEKRNYHYIQTVFFSLFVEIVVDGKSDPKAASTHPRARAPCLVLLHWEVLVEKCIPFRLSLDSRHICLWVSVGYCWVDAVSTNTMEVLIVLYRLLLFVCYRTRFSPHLSYVGFLKFAFRPSKLVKRCFQRTRCPSRRW